MIEAVKYGLHIKPRNRKPNSEITYMDRHSTQTWVSSEVINRARQQPKRQGMVLRWLRVRITRPEAKDILKAYKMVIISSSYQEEI